MAIRDRFRRALRKSESSDTEISQTDSNTTTATTSETSSLHKSTSSKLGRSWTWGRRSEKDESEKEAKRNRKNKKTHPSQRPLTLQNLKHQEMLGHFNMTFGASDPSQIESASFIGVSPCCTRAPSLEIDRAESSPSLTDSPNPDSVRE